MTEAGSSGDRRLDGWKSIANYFNRDRTTVMRWARDRGLPVRRLPGGKSGSVFAFERELAAWALRHGDLSPGSREPLVVEVAPPVAPEPARPGRWRMIVTGLIALSLAIVGDPSGWGLTGAWIWFACRLVYIPLYLAGIPYVRSLVWVGSVVGLCTMLATVLF